MVRCDNCLCVFKKKCLPECMTLFSIVNCGLVRGPKDAWLCLGLFMEMKMDKVQVVEVKRANKAEKGASLVEYALLVALIAIIAIVAIKTLGETISKQFSNVSGQLGG